MRREGSRVAAISRAVAVSEAIGRIARSAIASAGEAGEQRAAEDAGDDEQPESLIVDSTCSTLRPYWT